MLTQIMIIIKEVVKLIFLIIAKEAASTKEAKSTVSSAIRESQVNRDVAIKAVKKKVSQKDRFRR